MPLFVEGQDPRGEVQTRAPLGQPAPDPFAQPSLPETVGAAFRLNNPVASVISAVQSSSPSSAYDPDHNPLDSIRGTKYEDHLSAFVGSPNQATTRSIMSRIDQEEKDRQTYAASGWAGTVAGLAAGALDPTFYIPFVGEGAAATHGLLASAGRMALLGGLQTAASEGVLQASQQTRTMAESAGNVASGTLLMGMLGAGAGALMSRAESKAAASSMDALRRDFSPAVQPVDHAGAAAAHVDPEIAAILNHPDVAAAINKLKINKADDVPYVAGAAKDVNDPLVNIDRHLPDQLTTASDTTFDTTPPLAIHEIVERHVMQVLKDAGWSDDAAYRTAHYGFAEPAEHGWYRANGVVPEEAEKAYEPFIKTEGSEKVERQAPDLYQKPYPHGTDKDAAKSIETEPHPSQAELDEAHRLVREQSPQLAAANENAPPEVTARFGGAQSVGAAAADQRTMQLKPFLPGEKANEVFSAVMAKPNPVLRAMRQPSLAARRATGDLVDLGGLVTEDAKHGITPAQHGMALDTQARIQISQMMMRDGDILERNWMNHYHPQGAPKFFPKTRALLDTALGRKNGRLNYDEFSAAVTAAHIAGDVHDIPEVQKAAQEIRAQILDPLKKRLQEVKDSNGRPLLGEELGPPKGDKGFFFRIPNKDNIAKRWNEYIERRTDWLASEQAKKAAAQQRLEGLTRDLEESGKKLGKLEGDALAEETARHDGIRAKIEQEIADWQGKTTKEAKAALKAREKAETERAAKMATGESKSKGQRLTSADKSVDKAVKDILASDRDLSRQELRARAEEIHNRYLATVDGRLPYDEPSGGPAMGANNVKNPVRGSLNERVDAIPTSELPGFWHDDHEHVMAAALRTLIPDMLLTERFGHVEMPEQFKKLNEDYDALKAGTTDGKKQTALEKQRQETAEDLAAQRDRFRGVYGWSPDPLMRNAARVMRAFGQYNVITKLGSSIWNRMQDIGGPIARYAMLNPNIFGNAYLPFFKSMIGMSKVYGAARNEVKAMGVAIDGLLGQMTHNFGDVVGHGMGGNKFERALSWGSRVAMDVTGHSYWTDIWKTLGAHASSDTILRIAGKEALSPKETEFLAQAGINPVMAGRIAKAYADNGGQMIDGVHIPNTDSWKDRGARDAFIGAIQHEANINVITPGAEKPLLMSKPAGAMIFQFKSFVFGATQRILLAQMQQRDAATLMGFVTMMGLGMMSYRIYTLLSGQPVSDRPQDWIKEGFTRAAIGGWTTDFNAAQAKMFAGKTDMWNLIGADKPLTRYANRTALSDLFGPTFSSVEAAKDLIGEASSGRWSAHDTHKFRELMILQNWFPVRRLFDKVEDMTNSAFGIPLRKQAGPS